MSPSLYTAAQPSYLNVMGSSATKENKEGIHTTTYFPSNSRHLTFAAATSIQQLLHWIHRALVSVGAEGAAVPTDFNED